ncbi:patatin-like phospholipase family protein [Pseudorhodoferax sp. Leaf267]|uniref:patatin-like phospholipase family protein n=1 Tax=Pseudorhodoferax sp. Leaf267 TaxID=1736316 RepID=UPI0006F8711D|nr:patatin-like phospholipase family protein [Pseudorhodoferax sp. Leaf267]KQP19576.1 hypothetical protein ASF43_28730 [Pseudorhodoferax sp. Leaf267]
MTAPQTPQRKEIPPGDDVCAVPPPVDEEPPIDRFCDLVLTGGVASGVVYPWAIVELARVYRFQSIGGTSVGAMAAALAAASEYGRRTGCDAPFEALRRTPAALGEMLPDGRTRMLSLFQTHRRGRRLIELWGRLARGRRAGKPGRAVGGWPTVAAAVLTVYRWPSGLGALAGLALAAVDGAGPIGHALSVPLGGLAGLGLAVWGDVRCGLVGNGLGLCKGGTMEAPGPEGRRPGLSEWLHEGIQACAGLQDTDRPLTFRDLWSAPAYRGAAPERRTEDDPVDKRTIDLRMITTNVTHGRPYRLPLADQTSRLFYSRDEWKDYFPQAVLDALELVARPYEPSPAHGSDPSLSEAQAQGLLELPTADLPVVVAARLSLSFPLLFSAVPLWAIDYEAPRGQRKLRPCWFSDGGISSNFPIHFFDESVPRWPTFGLWLDSKGPYDYGDVWLPDFIDKGWGDNWNRFDPRTRPAAPAAPGASPDAADHRPDMSLLSGFLLGVVMAAKDWRDRTSMRLPHVRTRVARMLLAPDEGGLHIAMSRQQILDMAGRYGTTAGKRFVQQFAEGDDGHTPAWRDQRLVRLQLLVNGLRERLTGLAANAAWPAHATPMAALIARAKSTVQQPMGRRSNHALLNGEQARELQALLLELERLENVLSQAQAQPTRPGPEPELRLRSPL